MFEKNMVLPVGDGAAASGTLSREPHLPQKRSSTGTWFPQPGHDFIDMVASKPLV
jgi:hypothetical protein